MVMNHTPFYIVQVRKYLLMLDKRKDHVKFWRPQILLMVSNPRANCELIDFVNDIKKGGLYVLGHVELGDLDEQSVDPCYVELSRWQSLIDYLKIKAFVELTLSNSIRSGMHHLIRVSGLGGMKPNTICFGYYDNTIPEDSFAKLKARKTRKIRFYSSITDPEGDITELYNSFPDLRTSNTKRSMHISEYVHMIYDSLKLSKNVCLFKNFQRLDKDEIFKSGNEPMFIDVWPVNFFRPDTANYFDNTCLFMLQLACILHMVPGWKSKTKLRVFMCLEDMLTDDTERKKVKLANLLRQLRIPGEIQMITWRNVTEHLDVSTAESADSEYKTRSSMLAGDFPPKYLPAVNELVRNQCQNTAVTFCYLPKAPEDIESQEIYLKQLSTVTEDFPPTVLVHGLYPVTSTTL